MRHLSHTVPKVAGQAFSRKYIMLGRLITQWADIVGADMAAKTAPVGTHYMKSGKKSDKPLISLDIAATSTDATLLMYRKDLILERINQVFGQEWVTAIRFVPMTSNRRGIPQRRMTKSLTQDEKSYLSGVLDTVADDDLKARLLSLGTAILQDRRS